MSLRILAIKLNIFSSPTHTHTHTCVVSQCVCVVCLSKLVRHIYAVSMYAFRSLHLHLHLHREIISCIAMPIHLSATPTSAPIHTYTHSHRAHMSIFMAHPWLSSCELERARKRERETYINLYRCVRPNPYIEISFPIRFCFPFSPP